jgi:YYY domain-containing protein
VILDWLAREGWMLLSWWALATAAGAAALPLVSRLLAGLPDKGYTLARAAGMLLVGYVYWLLASLGFLQNAPGSIALVWVIVLVLGLAVHARQPINRRTWWRENRPVVITAELLFIVLFVGWTVVRAHQPELRTTEKPMDLMFISSIMRSEVFPPNDAWMAGYAISYYYFGYVMGAMLSMMSGVTSTVGYNLWNAMLFALTGLTVFGVTYNLARARLLRPSSSTPRPQGEGERTPPPDSLPIQREGYTGETDRLPAHRPALLAGLLGAALVVLMGNFQAALVELPYQSRTASEGYLQFWATQERMVYPERLDARAAGIPDDQPVTLFPVNLLDPAEAARVYWWWFRASRVLTDFNLDGTVSLGAQPIDEFPQFSFLLSDNHPHVMALPFAALALGLALNLLLAGRDPTRGEVVFYALSAGALVFLNTWDGPIYMLALVGADGLRRLLRRGWLRRTDWWMLFNLLLALGVLTALFYLPFIIGFRSQASGLLPNIITPTFLQHYFLMFGPFIVLLGPFLVFEARKARQSMNWRLGFQVVGGLLVALVAVLVGLGMLAQFVPELRGIAFRFIDENGGIGAVLPAILGRRLEALPTLLLMLAGLVVVVARLFPHPLMENEETAIIPTTAPPTGFALLLVGLGLGLTLVPEFFYLRDVFGTRINTIFKFYYQAWLVFGIAGAFAVYSILAGDPRKIQRQAGRWTFGAAAFVAVALGMIYPALAIPNRMFVETGRAAQLEPRPLSLDGGTTFIVSGDLESILCFEQQVQGDDVVVVEAIGGAYNPAYGRVGALTGVPILLGWENHERQWRGPTYDQAVGSRPDDIRKLYSDLRWDTALEIIRRYGIDYIFYGSSERAAYGSAGEDKFREILEPLCESGDSVFYRVTETALAASSR